MEINLIFFILFLFTYLVLVIVIGLRMKIAFLFLNENPPLTRNCEASILTSAVNVLFPLRVGGLLVKPYFFKKAENIEYEKSLSVTLIEQMFDTLFQLFVFVTCIYFFTLERVSYHHFLLIILVSFLLFLTFYEKRIVSLVEKILFLVNYLPNRVERFIRAKSPIRHKNIVQVMESIQSNRHRGVYLLSILLITLLSSFLLPLLMYSFFRAMSIEIPYFQMFVIYWISLFLGRVSGVPGGLGVRDGAIVLLLVNYGINMNEAALVTISFRVIFSFVLAVLGILIVGKYKIRLSQFRRS